MDDQIFNVRTMLKVGVDVGPLTFVGELLDSRLINGDDGGGAAGEIDTLEPIQLYGQWISSDAFAPGAKLDLKAGRFAMDIGSRRLTARANFCSFVQSFDGVEAVWKTADDLTITAFAVHPAGRAPSDTASALDNEVVLNRTFDNIAFTGLHLDAPLPHDLRGEAYAFRLDERDASDAPARDRYLLTLGARLLREPDTGVFDLDLEYARQIGTARATNSALDEARDRFGNSGVVDPTGASGSDVGQQIEPRYRRWLEKGVLLLSLGGAALFNSDFLKNAPNATGQDDAFYSYTELTWTF